MHAKQRQAGAAGKSPIINRRAADLTATPERRLPPGAAILVIGALSVLSWALFVAIGMAVRSFL